MGSLTIPSSTLDGILGGAAAAGGGTLDLAQISTGSLSGGAVNLTSLTQDFFLLYITGVNFIPSIRLNNNSGSVYSARTLRLTSSFDSWNGNDRWDLGTTAYSNSSNEWYITIQNGKANGMHTVNYWGYYNSTSAAIGGGYFTNETAITQINIIANGGSFSAGTYTLIGG